MSDEENILFDEPQRDRRMEKGYNELYDLHYLQRVIRMIKTRRMGLEGHVAGI
jgi:hypothetical protein